MRNRLAQATSSKFFKVFFWDVLSKGSDFILLPVYLKLLSPKEYGFYSYVIYLIISISGVLKLGIDTAVSKLYYETDKYNRGNMLFTLHSVWFSLFFLIASICILTGLDVKLFTEVLNISPEDYLSIKYFIFIAILVGMIQATLNVFYVISDDAITFQKNNLVRIVLGNAIIIASLYFLKETNKAYFRLSLEPILFFIFFIPLLIKFIGKFNFQIDRNALRDGLSVALPMLGTLIVSIIYNISDKYFLQKASGFETLAVYNLAIVLCSPVTLIFSSFQTVWFPKFSQEKSDEARMQLSKKFSKRLIYTYIAIFVCLMIGIYIAIQMGLIEKTYLLVLSILPIVFFAKVAETLMQVFNNFVVIWGKTMFNLVSSIVFALVTFALNYYVITRFGITGAACTLLIMSILKFAAFYYFVRSQMPSPSF
jgi:O-antigen/teichoic acid export membrane protein